MALALATVVLTLPALTILRGLLAAGLAILALLAPTALTVLARLSLLSVAILRLAALGLFAVLAGIGPGLTERITVVVLGQLVAGAIVGVAVLSTLASLGACLSIIVLVVSVGCSILAGRRGLAGVAELLAVGWLVVRQLLGQIIQLVLRKTQCGRIVAQDGLGRAFDSHAKLVEVLRRAGLERAGLANQPIIHQLGTVFQIIRGGELGLLAQ